MKEPILIEENIKLFEDIIKKIRKIDSSNYNSQKNGIIKLMNMILEKKVLNFKRTDIFRNDLGPLTTYVDLIAELSKSSNNYNENQKEYLLKLHSESYFKTLSMLNKYLYTNMKDYTHQVKFFMSDSKVMTLKAYIDINDVNKIELFPVDIFEIDELSVSLLKDIMNGELKHTYLDKNEEYIKIEINEGDVIKNFVKYANLQKDFFPIFIDFIEI